MSFEGSTRQYVGAKLRTFLCAGTVLAAGAMLPVAAQAGTILNFSQASLDNPTPPVTATANGSTTTISVVDDLVSVVMAGFGSTTAYFSLTSTSYNEATTGLSGNVRQNYTGSFTITSGKGGTGTNYLSGTFNDLFEATNRSATLSASTPPDDSVVFSSDKFSAAQLMPDRSLAFSFSGVTPGVTSPNADGTIPSFQASVTGTFSADVVNTPVPEPISLALLGTGLIGLGMVKRRRA